MNIQVNEKQLPVIKTNFEEVKVFLTDKLEKYKGLVVTEQSLDADKTTKKEMTTLRKTMDDKRKEIKKDLLVPIDEMEKQFKELITIVDGVLIPIKEGLNVFDEKKRQANIDYAKETIKQYVIDLELNEIDFIMQSNFSNMTTTKKAIKEEITRQATELRNKKDQPVKNTDLLKNHIQQLNESFKLEVKIMFGEYASKITDDNFMELSQQIMQEASRRKELQEKMAIAMKEKADVINTFIKPTEEIKDVDIEEKEITTLDKETGEITTTLTITLQFNDTEEKLIGLRKYIDDNEIKFKKL